MRIEVNEKEFDRLKADGILVKDRSGAFYLVIQGVVIVCSYDLNESEKDNIAEYSQLVQSA